jgi:hypothetical protein
VTTGKQVPLAEVSRLREQRRKLQAEIARLEAEKQGWLVEKAYLIWAVGHRTVDPTSRRIGRCFRPTFQTKRSPPR